MRRAAGSTLPACPPSRPQLTGFFSFDIFYYVVMGYTGLVVIHAVITTRDGYCVSLSNQLGAKLRRWRQDPRACCGSAWTPIIWLLERVGASSARPVPHEYLAPYHMKVAAGKLIGPGDGTLAGGACTILGTRLQLPLPRAL